MYNVAVLISTYNGERFIEQQIQSILAQKSTANIDIFIRDDGSSDNTIELIKKINANNIRIFPSGNIGVYKSFLSLLSKVDSYDYYFLCDQDDYWKDTKIQSAINLIVAQESNADALLYCSALDVVDSELNFLRKINQRSEILLGNGLIESCATGCTMAFNEKLREYILRIYEIVDENSIVMHDSFILKIGLIVGTVISDKNSHIKYRQHENNVIGANVSKYDRVIGSVNNIFDKNKRNFHLVETFEILNALKCLGNSNYKQLIYHIKSGLYDRLKFAMFSGYFKRNFFSNVFFKLFVVLGLYKNV